jgi:hypothetical protein
MGLTRPKTSVSNYRCTLRNVSEVHRSHKMIWQCRPWFGSTWSGSEQSGLTLYVRIEGNLTYLSTKCKGKKLILQLSKYSNSYDFFLSHHWVTKSVEQIPLWEADRSSARQDFLYIYWARRLLYLQKPIPCLYSEPREWSTCLPILVI